MWCVVYRKNQSLSSTIFDIYKWSLAFNTIIRGFLFADDTNHLYSHNNVLFKSKQFFKSWILPNFIFCISSSIYKHASIAWASTSKTYLKGILGKQKQVARLISSDDIFIPSRLSMKELNIINVYQTKNQQHLLFMFKIQSSIIPRPFRQVFSLKDPLYPTR